MLFRKCDARKQRVWSIVIGLVRIHMYMPLWSWKRFLKKTFPIVANFYAFQESERQRIYENIPKNKLFSIHV